MPITRINNNNTNAGGTSGTRTTFRPPWAKDAAGATAEDKGGDKKVEAKPTPSWKKPAPKASDTSVPEPIPILKKTVKTQQSTAGKPENGEEKEVTAKLQSREVKVPVMTERARLKPTPIKPKEKEEEKVKEKEPEEEPKPVATNKFVRPVLRKTPKVDEVLKEIEKPKAPTVILKKIEPIKKEIELKKRIDINLQKTPITKKEAEFKPTLGRKLAPVKFSAKNLANLAANLDSDDEDDEGSEEEECEEEEETETEESSEEESTEEESVAEKKPAPPPVEPPKKMPAPGPAPPPPPPPPKGAPGPPPPPPPPQGADKPPEAKPLTEKRKKIIEKLKTRPRRRPDWSDMMKEVESGRKLKHVQCNDRSNPILTSKSMTKVQGVFIYETEKGTKLNKLLGEIQTGVRLRPTRTNDRSKPNFEGLRKFRRQMTIEEQIQKSESRVQLDRSPSGILGVEPLKSDSPDEMDDIDKLRDDLQSTKQLLSIELRNKEAQDRENKRLLARIQNLEVELKKAKTSSAPPVEDSIDDWIESAVVDDKIVDSLKKEADDAQETAKELEKKFHETAEQLDAAKSEIEKQKAHIAQLEKKFTQVVQGTSANDDRRQSLAAPKDESPEPDFDQSESEEDEDEDKKNERRQRRMTKEVKWLRSKLIRLKEKLKVAKKERETLRDAMKKNNVILKDEKKKYKKLQKEVDKMALLMKDVEDEDDENADEAEEPQEEAPEVEESESESESEESEVESGAESESSESEPEDAPAEKKRDNFTPRVSRHEGRLSALKKGNYLLQANVERLLDEINKTRELSNTLQTDLNAVLSELG